MAKEKSSATTQLDPLEEFRDALSKQTGEGRDMERAREISDAYIAAHPEEFKEFVGLDEHELAAYASVLSAGAETVPQAARQVTLLEMWVRSTVKPQEIGGTVQAERRAVPDFDPEQEVG